MSAEPGGGEVVAEAPSQEKQEIPADIEAQIKATEAKLAAMPPAQRKIVEQQIAAARQMMAESAPKAQPVPSQEKPVESVIPTPKKKHRGFKDTIGDAFINLKTKLASFGASVWSFPKKIIEFPGKVFNGIRNRVNKTVSGIRESVAKFMGKIPVVKNLFKSSSPPKPTPA